MLGIDFETSESISIQFEDIADEVASIHSNFAQVEDVATEMVLTRACANVCKVVHLLRAAGEDVNMEALKKYDNIYEGHCSDY